MRIAVCQRAALAVLTLLVTACAEPPVVAEDAPVAVRIDANRIDRVLTDMVERNAVAGVSALVFVNGSEVYFGSAGHSDVQSGRAFSRDTLVPIYSMTKPVTGITLMSLYQQGLFDLDAPLADYLPEYRDVQVITGRDDQGEPILVPPRRPIQVIDLFRYTACFGYGWEDHPASEFMNAASPLDSTKPLAQFSRELATVPLYCHPGEQWKYGVAVDVQARLAEVVTGRPFEALIYERVLTPLKMTETAYSVAPDQAHRIAVAYRPQDGTAMERIPEGQFLGVGANKPVQINGGHGLIATIDDYMRFAEMLRRHGSLDDVQVLRPETLAMMTRDHLSPEIVERDFLPSKGQMGFGLNFAVRIAPPVDDDEPYGVVGEFFWDGAASTLFWVDRENNLSAVFYTQVMPFDGVVQAQFRRAVYDALGLTRGGR